MVGVSTSALAGDLGADLAAGAAVLAVDLPRTAPSAPSPCPALPTSCRSSWRVHAFWSLPGAPAPPFPRTLQRDRVFAHRRVALLHTS